MRTVTVHTERGIAVMAKNAKARREVILHQPPVKASRSDLSSVLIASSVYVINCQKLDELFTAARTLRHELPAVIAETRQTVTSCFIQCILSILVLTRCVVPAIVRLNMFFIFSVASRFDFRNTFLAVTKIPAGPSGSWSMFRASWAGTITLWASPLKDEFLRLVTLLPVILIARLAVSVEFAVWSKRTLPEFTSRTQVLLYSEIGHDLNLLNAAVQFVVRLAGRYHVLRAIAF